MTAKIRCLQEGTGKQALKENSWTIFGQSRKHLFQHHNAQTKAGCKFILKQALDTKLGLNIVKLSFEAGEPESSKADFLWVDILTTI